MRYGDLPANWSYDDLSAQWGTTTSIYCDARDIPKLASRWGWLQWNSPLNEACLDEQERLRRAIDRIVYKWEEEHKKPFPHDIDKILRNATLIARAQDRIRY